MLVAAVVCADRKNYLLDKCFKALVEEPAINCIYLNVESRSFINYDYALEVLHHYARNGRFWDFDICAITSSWHTPPQYDQDQARLSRIIIARNMAIEYAIFRQATHLLFVDSDVVIHPGGVQKLLELNKPISGGVVPGRGEHRHANYIFGGHGTENGCLQVRHGTAGYMLIRNDVFTRLRFRQGPHPTVENTWLSEDPAYAADAAALGLADSWWIHPKATADHLDNPDKPLTTAEAVNDYHVI